MTRADRQSEAYFRSLRDTRRAGLPAPASAAPVVSVKARSCRSRSTPARRQPYISGTGNMLGAGAALEAEVKNQRHRYAAILADHEGRGGVALRHEASSVWIYDVPDRHSRKPRRAHCPNNSFAAPWEKCRGGQLRPDAREEKATSSLLAAGNKLAFYTEGTTPASLESSRSAASRRPHRLSVRCHRCRCRCVDFPEPRRLGASIKGRSRGV